MKVYNVVQGSEAWLACRRGLPTASGFHRIFQQSRKKPSRQRDLYLLELVDAWLTGKSEESFRNKWTERGQQLEPAARFAYEMEHNRAVRRVGFVSTDDGRCGCSPDGLVADDTLLEIKIPSPQIIGAYHAGAKDPKHTAQIQGSLWITERSQAHLWIYNEAGESILKPIPRDNEWIEEFVPVLNTFLDDLETEKHSCRAARIA